MLKRTGLLASGRNGNSRTSRGKEKAKPGRLASAIKPVLETLETRQMLSLAAGSLDPTFGTSGLLTTSLSSEDQGTDVAVDPTSGDIFVAGTSGNHFTLVAYSPSGDLLSSDSIAIGTGSSSANAVTIDSSHNIWVAGVADDGAGLGNDFVLAKFAFTGGALSLQAGFGGSGYVTTDVQTGKSDTGNAVAIDGSDILVAGDTGSGTTQRAAVVAYQNNTGSLDTSFGVGGKVIGTGTSESANGIAVSASGIVVAGQASSKAEILLMSSTGTGVTSKFPAVGGSSDLMSVVADGSDDLLAGTADSNFVLAAVNASSGLLDSSFGTSGVTETAFTGASQANAIAVQSNGKIVLAGSTTVSGNQVFAVARYSVTGSADPNFGTGGIAMSATFSGTDTVAAGVAVEPDGKIVAAGFTGSTTDSFAVARYVANNAPTGAGSASFSTIDASQTNSPGDTVPALVSQLNPADADGDTVGLAVTATDDSNGTWQYSTDSGSHWTAIPAISDASAFVLTKLASNLIRFVPNTSPTPFTGNATITLRLWDQTQTYANASLVNAYNSTVTNTSANSGPSAQNLNSFSDAAFTATITISSLVSTVYVDQAWAGSTQDETVSDSHGTHIFGIDAFASIQNGVTFVGSGGTVIVDAGTYAENVDVKQSLSILGPNAGVDPNNIATPRGAEAVVVPAVADIETGDGGTGDTNGTILRLGDPNNPTNAITVTINGLTIDGNNSSLPTSQGRLLNGVYVDTGAGIDNSVSSYDTNPGGMATTMIVTDNIIENLDRYGVLGDTLASATPQAGASVTNNKITNIPSGNNFGGDRGRGVAFEDNYYGTVSNNTITDVNVGYQNDNFYLPDPSGHGLIIENNTISAYHRGIFYNLVYDTASNGTIENNTLSVDTTGFGADANNFGLEIISLESGVGVTVSNNSDTGNAYGVLVTGDSTTAGLTVSGGTLTGNKYGVYVTDNDPQFPADGNTPDVVLSGITITGAISDGVFVEEANGQTVGATIAGGTSITGGPTGIVVSGPHASLSFSGASAASLSGQSGNYITLTNGAMNGGAPSFTPSVIDASGVTFNSLGGGNPTTLAQYYAIEDKIADYLDDPSLGYVKLNAGNVYLAHSSESPNAGSIQRGINVAVANDTVNVQAGTYVGANLPDATNGYVDAVQITKPLSLVGPNSTYDPTQAEPASQAILLPGSSDPSFDSTESAGIEIASNNVTVEGLTFDGSNPSLTHNGNVIFNGVPIDAAEGIDGFSGLSGVTVAHNIIKNTDYAGVNFDNPSAATSDNTISDNRIENLSDALGFGVGVIVYNNFYAQVTGNVMSDVTVGVQTGNFSQANPDSSFAPEISSNQISATGVGIFYNLMYDASSPFTVAGNTITAISSSSDAPWDGVLLTSIQSAVNVDFTGNSIDGSAAFESVSDLTTGYNIWNTPTTGNVLISGGTVTGVDYGVWVNTYEAYASNADATQATISGVGITANKIGVYVEDSAANTAHPAVTATIDGDTSVSTGGSGVGIEVSGSNASATISGNNASIYNNSTGILVTGGSATITNNHIYDNTTGIEFTNGGSGSVSDNDFAGLTDNGTDLLIDSTAGAVSLLDGNSFAGTADYIVDLSAQSYDLSSYTTTTFSGFNAATTAVSAGTLSSFYAVEDELVDAIDQSGLGFIRIHTASVFVTPNSFIAPGNDSGSLQRAINAASPGDTVYVEGGDYALTAQLTVPQGVTIQGPYAGVNPNTYAGPPITQAVVDGGISDQLLLITSTSSVSLEGLQFNHMLIQAYNGPAISLSDNTFTNIPVASDGANDLFFANSPTFDFIDNAITSDDSGGGSSQDPDFVQIAGNWDGTGGTHVDIEGNVQQNVGATGFNLSDVAGTISGNTFHNVDFYALLLANNTSVTVSGNIFNNVADLDTTDYPATGAVRFYTPALVNDSITSNTFENSYSGIAVRQGSSTTGAVISISGNTFTSNAYNIINLGTGELDPDGTNIFDGVTLRAATLPQLFGIADKDVDGVDIAGAGLVRLKANNVYVTPNSFYNPGPASPAIVDTTSPSIQRAVNVASPGDTVNIENGTYVGQVQVVAKNLTLLGQSQTGVVIQANSSLSSPFSTGSGSKNPIVYANGGTVTVNDLTVDGNSQGNAYADGFLGIAYYNAGGTVQNVTIENVENSPFNGLQNGIALYADNADSANRTLNITNDTLTNYQKGGMALFGNGLTLDVANNIVTGMGNTTQIAQNGIEVGDGAIGTISDNTVSGNEYSGSLGGPDQFTDAQSCGILVFSTVGLSISGNIVDGNDIGIYNNTDGAIISNNLLGNTTANRYEGIVQDQGSSTISGNTINGGNIGIDVVTFDGESGEAASAIVQANNIVSGAGVGLEAIVQTAGTDPAVAVMAQNNQFQGNTEGVLISGGAKVDLGHDSSDLAPGHSNFTGLGASTGHNILTDYAGGAGHYAIDDQNTPQGGEPDVLAEDNNFGPNSANNPSAIAQVINDHANNSALTTVFYLPALDTVTAPATVYVDSGWAGSAFGSDPGSLGGTHSYGYDEFSDIQTAINAVASGGTVMIDNGTYDPSNILINIPVTIEGASESGVIITPSLTDSHDDSSFGGTASNGFIIASSGVTIEDLTLDGGAGQNFRDGIITNSQNDGNTYDNITVEDVTVKNVFRKGIAIYNETGIATGVVIENDTLNGIGTTINDSGGAYEATAAIAIFGSDALVENNIISNSAGGIEANTFDGSAEAVTISGNSITAPATVLAKGALGIDAASLAGGSIISGNTVNLTGGTGNDLGIVVSFDQGAVTVGNDTVTGTGSDDGMVFYQNSTPVTVSGNTITGSSDTGAGILVSASASDTSRFGDVPGAVSATLTQNTVEGFADGIKVVSDGATGDTASANIGDGTAGGSNSISGAGVGIDVESGAAIISGNTISGATIGVKVAGGSATINNSNVITASENGILTQGGASIISGNTITGSISGVDVDGGSATINGGNIINGNTAVEIDSGSAAVSSNTINGTTTGVLITGGTGAISISGNTIDGSTSTAIRVDAKSPSISGNSISGAAGSVGIFIDGSGDPTIGAGNTVDGVSVGLSISGASAGIVGNTLNNLALTNISGNYVTLAAGAEGGPTPTQLDATNVLFGTVLGSAASLSQAYTIEDKISDYLDDPTLGYVMLNSNKVYVTQASDNTTNDAVQRGVNVSAAGGTVNVQAGTFIGQVQIPTNLSLVGSGQASTIIQAPASLPLGFTTTYNGAVNHPVVYVHNATVAIQNLTVDGNGQGSASGGGTPNYKITGIGYYNAAGTIDHVTVEHVRETPLNGDQQGVGIFVQNDDSVARTVNITNSDIFDYQKGGIVMNGAGLSGSITGNTITGAATLGINGQNGIQISRGAVAEVSGDVVGGNLYDGNTAAGILLFQAGAGVQVTGNTLTGNDIGLSSDGSTNAVLSGNTLSGNTDAIQLDDDATGTTIQNNLISSNTGTGVYIDSSVTDSSNPLTVNNNSISGNATAGLDNESTITVNATSNWWGSANGPQAASNSFNVGHQGDKIIGPGITTFAPWLTSGANSVSPPTPGFYPTGATSAPVEDVTQDTFFGSIQAAVNASSPGDMITVAAGTYIENITVPHSLTIEGAGYTSDPTASSVVESASNGPVFEISGGTVTLQNFYITAGINGKTAGVQVDGGAGVIISHVAINDPAVGLSVAAGASATVDDSTISNNLTGIISSGTLTVDDGSVISSNSVTGVELDGGSANLTGSVITGNTVGLWLKGNNIVAAGGVQNDSETDVDCNITGNNDTAQNMEMDTALWSVTNSGTGNILSNDTIASSVGGVQVVSGNITINGGSITSATTGVEVQSGGSAILQGASITGTGLGVMVDSGASATIEDDGTNPTVISDGGVGILVDGSLATQPDVPGSGHTALQVYGMTASGGHKGYGIEIGSGGSAEISNTELGIGSQASENGNSLVMDSGAGTVSVTGSSITDSTVAGIDVEGGTLTLTGSTISNPDLTSTSTGTLMFEGAGMIINGGSVTVLSTTISDTNVAIAESGAHTGVLIGNHKDVDADTFSDNTTGISVESGSLQVDDVNFQDNLTDMIVGNAGGSPTDPVTATASIVDSKNISDGAAKGQATDGIIVDNGGAVTLSGSSFSDYTDDAIQINGGIATIDGNNQFTNNNVGIAVKKQGNPTSGGHGIVIGDFTNGGNTFSGNTTAMQIDDGAVTITNNAMSNNVTAADVDGDGQADFTGNNFTDNTTGVIANSSVSVDSTNDTFTYDANETASSVVGLQVTSTGSADVSAVLYVRKQGSDQNSIAIESAGSLTVENGTQIGGFSTGVQITGGTALVKDSTIGAITVSPNDAPGNAVGLEATGGTVTVQDTTFDDNTVSGIDIETGGSVIVNGGTFQNTALESTTQGTVVYNGDGIDDNSASPNSLAFNGGTITNTAVGMRYRPGNNKTTRIKITREWSNDTIASNGIGVEIDGGGADIGDATVSGDPTTGGANFSNNGTAVLVDGDAQVNLIDNTITGGIGQIGIDDSSSQAVDSTGDTISGSSGNDLLVGRRMHKPINITAIDVTSGDVISYANTGIDDSAGIASISGNTMTNNGTAVDIEGSGVATLAGNTLTDDSVGIDDESTGAVTSTGDTIGGTNATDITTTGVKVGHGHSMSMDADDIGFVVTGIDDDGTIHIASTTNNNVTTGTTIHDAQTGIVLSGDSSATLDSISEIIIPTNGRGVFFDNTADGRSYTGGRFIIGLNAINTTAIEVAGGSDIIDGTSISGVTTGVLVDAGQTVTIQDHTTISGASTGVDIEGGTANINASTISDDTDGIKNDSETGVSSVFLNGTTLSDNATGITLSGGGDDSATLDSASKIILPTNGVGVLMTDDSNSTATNTITGGSISDDTGSTNTVGIEVTDNLGKKHNYIGHVTIVKPTIGAEVYGEATFTDDTITNNDIGVIVESTGTATIGTGGFGNDISDNTTTGIELTAGSSGSVSNNFIQGNGTGVLFDSGFTGSMTVLDNNISGNTTAGLDNASSASINADLNYWGTSNGPTIASNPGGTGDVIIGSHITFIPWLTNGTDADADRTDGFQPEPGDTVPSNLILNLSASKINEDGTASLSGSFTDTGSADTHTVDINWGDGSADTILTLPATTLSFNNVPHQYLDNPTGQPHGSFTISVTVTDTDGASTAANTSVEVDNVAPVVAITGAPSSAGVAAGPPLVLGSTIADPSPIDQAASFTYVWSVTLNGNPYTTNLSGTSGSITPSGITGPSLTFTSTPLFGNYVATLVVTDKDGGQTTTSSSFKINEVTPAITLSGSQTDPTNPTPNDAEGSTFTLTLSPLQESDLIPGGDKVDSYTILWGDGSTNITGAQLANLVANGGTVTHVYEDGLTPESTTPNTTIQVIVDITDGFGTEHAFSPATGGNLPLDVYNLPPTAQLTGTSSVQEGSSGFVQFLNQSDPSPVDSAAGFTYEYDFNNSGNFSSPTTNSFATVPASVLATPGTDTVAARIYDKDGGFTTDTFQITVTNVAPTVNTIPNITNQPQNSAFHVNGTFTDPGSDSPWVVFVNYDSTHVAGIGSQIQSGPSKSFSLSNAYATPGVYTVLVTVEDLGGPSNNALSLSGNTTFTVTVTATTFQVTQFTPTPSGFDVTFNRAVNTSALRLYGSTLLGGGGTISDLTITGQNTGPVTGSVVWDPTTNTAHFIKTGGPLVDDVYSVTLLSGPNGWKDTSGDQLDGLDNGGTSNYTNTITVNAPTNEPVVSIPDFARGPGQSVNVTPAPTANTTALGLPVSIFNATNIVAVDFDLVYNPALLSITGATKAAGLPSNWGLTVNQISPSQFNFTISGTTPISGSMLSLIILTAKVPNGAPYASAADLLLTNLVVSQQSVGTIPSLADSTMQKVAYLGDTDGDGTLTGNDAGLISRVVVHLDTGFDAYPLTDPTLIGDVSNDGVITGFDASEDLAASVGFSEPTIPNIPNIGTLVTGGIDPNVSIGSNIIATGSTAVVPINIDDLTGVNGLTVTVGFNSSAVQLSDGSDVAVSNALSPYFTAIYNPANGKIGIEENNPPMTGLTGPATLVNLTFTVPANSNPGVDSVTVTGPASVGSGATKLNYTYTNGSIVIPPTFVGNNQFTVALDGSGNVDVWQDVPETSTPTYVFAQSLLNSPGFSTFSFTTTQSGGSLTIDDKNGNPLPTGGVVYNATGTGNSVTIDANSAGGDAVTVGSSSEALDGDALSLSNVQNFVFNGGAANDTLTQTSQPTVPVTFNGNGGADILNVNGGSYTLSGSENPAESLTVNVNNAGSSVTFGSSYTLAALNIGNGASAQIALSTSTPSVLVTSALSILGSGKLDMTNNELIFHSTAANRVGDLAALTSLLASGASFNNFSTYWAGSGIDSSTAAGDHTFITGVGIMLNDAGSLATPGPTYTTTFGGQTVSNTDILVRFTYYGDADLNGTVNAIDYTLVDNGFNMGQTGWVHGDFNYDQSVNGDDYTLMDNAFNTQSANQIEVLAVNSEQVATSAPSVAAAAVSATTKAPTAANAVAATGGSTTDDTTDLKKKHRSIYNLVEDSDQSNS